MIRHTTFLAALLAGLLAIAGCNLYDIAGNDELPSEVTDPAITHTKLGALAAYNGTLAQFRSAFGGDFVLAAGLISDELTHAPNGGYSFEDLRDMGSEAPSRAANAYSSLQRTRGQASQSIGLLGRYAPGSDPLRAHLYAVQGYAEVLLAELFCSGIPLSTIDFEGDYTLRPGSPTDEVFGHAVALFDTARTLAGDSARYLHLANIGRARALLGRGDYEAAAAAAAEVPDDYRYVLHFSAAEGAGAQNYAYHKFAAWDYSVPDREGTNGLDFRSANDPRAPLVKQPRSGSFVYYPAMYRKDGSAPMVLTGGVEARLIQAEVALKAGNASWLQMLNTLRTNGTFTTRPNANDPSRTDTLWNAGSGGVAGLAPLSDPGTDQARVSLLFRERAFWLFQTGHRLGDMRRLVRQYGGPQENVFPVGLYPRPGGIIYGGDVSAPIPQAEQKSNPQFTGCLSHGA